MQGFRASGVFRGPKFPDSHAKADVVRLDHTGSAKDATPDTLLPTSFQLKA